jgi:hypothetical protein
MRNLFKASPKPMTIAIVLAMPILLMLVCFAFWFLGGGLASSYWMQEIERRGWRVLYSKNTGDRLVAICDAGANRLALIDTDWPIMGYQASCTINVMDSQHHGISAGDFDLLQCNERFHINRVTGCIVRVKVPEDGRIRIVRQAGYFYRGETKSGGEILLDIEVDWNVGEPLQKP